MPRHELTTVVGSPRLVSAKVTLGTAFAADPTNYWTISLRTIRDGEEYGTEVSSFSTSTFNLLVDGTTIYNPASSLPLVDGSRVVADLTATGSPLGLVQPVIWLEMRE